ncbi:hypothetical protein Tco_1422271 [Tanacetum coccineum]
MIVPTSRFFPSANSTGYLVSTVDGTMPLKELNSTKERISTKKKGETENQAKMTKLTEHGGMEKTCKSAKSKNPSQIQYEDQHSKPEPELQNTKECNLYPSDGPESPIV